MKITPPILETKRFILRPFVMTDTPLLQKLAGHKLIYDTTAGIPHPYPDGEAERWILANQEGFAAGTSVQLAIVLKDNDELVGSIGYFGISEVHRKAELGYWIAVDYWGKGYCTEAAAEMINWAFANLNLNRIVARHMGLNEGSGKVMRKLGMKKEGTLRQDAFKNGEFHDMEIYSVLRDDLGF